MNSLVYFLRLPRFNDYKSTVSVAIITFQSIKNEKLAISLSVEAEIIEISQILSLSYKKVPLISLMSSLR